ncbi:hypothetical protein MOD31_10970 [Paenarthrobacter sp. TYUT067]|uniref:hypothetical protein n=1 Tax=Paenarthrobacter sp. TYUT067 TaxID=2926245 RepID=UPI00202F2905|nr:hypothetical protein [Paenarthrobacter sp. TYUT067]MCM0616546.1 hypothetical protein [Paenarthrobacter sp. TYUT067]
MNHPQDPEPILQNLVRDVAMILHHGLSEAVARGQYPLPSRTIDLDDEVYLRKMPAHDRWRHLERLIKAANPRLSDIGLAQTDNDVAAHVLISEKLRERVPGSIVVGEEASERDWAKCGAAPAGTLVWQLDAIDGSALQDTVGFGYSANVILYRKVEGAPAEPVVSVTVTSSSTMMAWVYTGQVGASHLNSIDPHTGEPMILELLEPVKSVEQVREGWVAVVAAQAKDRAKVRPLFETDLSIMTLGGAPALPGLLLEKLAAIVIPSPQTRHDAPLLPLASHMGMHFIDIATGENYSDADVRAFFAGIAHPNDVDYKPVPAMVISRDLLFGIELANIIRNGRRDKAS